jgi:hypothetical protein
LRGRNTHASGRVQKQIGSRLAAGDVADAEDPAREALVEPREPEGEADLLVCPARRDAGRDRDCIERLDDAGNRLELGLERLPIEMTKRSSQLAGRRWPRWASMSAVISSSLRPMNRSTTSASVIGQPSSASTITSIRTAMRSVSTRTPSQSKITREIEGLTLPERDRTGRRRRSVGAAELAVVPGDDARRREAQHDALGRLLQDARPRFR